MNCVRSEGAGEARDAKSWRSQQARRERGYDPYPRPASIPA